jgi:hypothetical protein
MVFLVSGEYRLPWFCDTMGAQAGSWLLRQVPLSSPNTIEARASPFPFYLEAQPIPHGFHDTQTTPLNETWQIPNLPYSLNEI